MSVKDIFEGIIPDTLVLEDATTNSVKIVPKTMNFATGEVKPSDMVGITTFEDLVREKLGDACSKTQNGLFFKETPNPELVGEAVTAVLSELGWKKA